MNIRAASAEDLDTLFAFEQELIAHERPLDPTLRQSGEINYYDLPELVDSNDAVVFIAEIVDSPVGCGFGKIETNKEKFSESL